MNKVVKFVIGAILIMMLIMVVLMVIGIAFGKPYYEGIIIGGLMCACAITGILIGLIFTWMID